MKYVIPELSLATRAAQGQNLSLIVLVAPLLLTEPCRLLGVIREMGGWSQLGLSLKVSKFKPC